MAAGRGVKVAAGAALVGAAALAALLLMADRGPWLAPDFAIPNLEGQAVRLSAHRGKVVLMTLWTTWCPPCREEMPSMERLYARLGSADFELLAVSQDEGGRRVVEPFVRELELSFPVLVDPDQEVGRRYGVWGYPESFVIDRNGYVVEKVVGPREWDAPEVVASLERLIAGAETGGGDGRAPRGPS